MKITLFLIALLNLSLLAQNAAVSSYLDPQTNGYADVRIREVRVPTSGYAICTYWCTLGYWTTGNTTGYGGIQWTTDNSQGPKNYIYSQWNDYSTSAFNDPATQVKTFGGEGTGVKSINNDPQNQWDPDYWHVTADRIWKEGSNTHFAYLIKNGKTGIWRHIMTWNTPESNLRVTGSYCFLEDWRGDGAYRESHIRRGWNRSSSNKQWTPITSYKYNINANDIAYGGRSYNKRTNWCGGIKEDATGKYFYMGAGGSVVSTNNKNSIHTIVRAETAPQEEYGVVKISDLKIMPLLNNSKLLVQWSNDCTTVPQFAYKIEIKDTESTLLSVLDTIPQKRSDTLDIVTLSPESKLYTVELTLVDMFDGISDVKSATFGKDPVSTISSDISKFNSSSLKFVIYGNVVRFENLFKSPAVFKLFTTNGKMILNQAIKDEKTILPTNISKGSYFWKVSNSKSSERGLLTISE